MRFHKSHKKQLLLFISLPANFWKLTCIYFYRCIISIMRIYIYISLKWREMYVYNIKINIKRARNLVITSRSSNIKSKLIPVPKEITHKNDTVQPERCLPQNIFYKLSKLTLKASVAYFYFQCYSTSVSVLPSNSLHQKYIRH